MEQVRSKVKFAFGTKIVRRAVLLIAVLLTFSCSSTIKETPFKDFNQSTKSLSEGVELSMQSLVTKNNARYKKEIADEVQNGAIDTQKLVLVPDGDDPFAFTAYPDYLVTERFRTNLLKIINGMHEYSTAILALAKEDVYTDEQFKQLANDLNANTLSAATAIDDGLSPDGGDKIALFSSASAAIFQQYIQSKKKEELIKALQTNQPTIEAFTIKITEAITIIAAALNHEFNEQSSELAKLVIVSNTSAAALDAMIALNKEHYAQITNLRTIKNALAAFPSAHKGLIAAIEDNDSVSFASISAFVEKANSVKAVYESAKIANKNSLLEAGLDDIEKQANKLKADSELAAIEAAKAKAEAVLARLESDADPGNTTKEDNASQLEARATLLQTVADEKAEAAKQALDTLENYKSAIAAVVNG